MKAVNPLTLAVIIVGGVNWGLVGAFDVKLVAALFGDQTIVSRAVYVLVGLSALWQGAPLARALRGGEASAEAAPRGIQYA